MTKEEIGRMEIGARGIAYPCFCARCHYPWIGKAKKEICPKCDKDDMVCTVEREEADGEA